jgi:integrase
MANVVTLPRRMHLASRLTVSKDGYDFDPAENSWKLNKDVTIYLGRAAHLPDPVQVGFRSTLQRYAEEMSASHAGNMVDRFNRFLNDTGADCVTSAHLLNWRAVLAEHEQWQLGGLRGFLLAWHDYGFPGMPDEAAKLLLGWRIKGNEKGAAVASGCPDTGPLSDLEVAALLDWANAAVGRRSIEFAAYAYLMTLIMTARRPVQIAALRGKDLIEESNAGARLYRINFPRAKQRGAGFRQAFRSLAVVEDLYVLLQEQHKKSVAKLEAWSGRPLDQLVRREVPIFLSERIGHLSKAVGSSPDAVLNGSRPDALHASTATLAEYLHACARLSTARSERTGEFIRLSATRFRRTRGTKLRREGFGAFVIAELLDHSDIQNVRIYTENTAQEAVVINELIGSQLAPYAQACMGTLVRSEREAIRGADPRSRVPNHQQDSVGTCGNYGFCASGYRACYTCHYFQPWMDGPHKEVLAELYAEKTRAAAAGCAREVVNANDRLILAVEHCVDLCEAARSKALLVDQEETRDE